MSDFMSELKKSADRMQSNISITENGAIGDKTSGKALVDCNFKLSSMRNMNENDIWNVFLSAYNENPTLALVWLFFARDAREGCGERRTFRIVFERFATENPAVASRLVKLIPFYGRWDDVIDLFCAVIPLKVHESILALIINQLSEDFVNINNHRPISLLGKWMPSANTSSAETRNKAELLRNALGYTPKQYRVTLSQLRKYLDVTETKMSDNEWGKIDYEAVPSRAAMNYRDAFRRHDSERYERYLANVRDGASRIHSGVLFPYDIVHAYGDLYWGIKSYDATLEAQWNSLPYKAPENSSTLVVVDGSGSMGTNVGKSNVSCHDVANSLGIYFAEKLSGPYHNSFITFSSCPQFVRFADGLSLHAKLKLMSNYNECSNTDIEKTFNLILDTAVRNKLKQDELPANILIVSDMEFDAATFRGGWDWDDCDNQGPVDQHLFDSIRERWESSGYKLPRLVFWNVCSRTGTIPVSTNEFGVALVSGFSPIIADMVMSGKLDPYECLVDKLMSERYMPVISALKE